MNEIQITMTFKKSTKGTHVYGNEDSAIPSVYIRKEAFGGSQPPQEVTLIIRENSDD